MKNLMKIIDIILDGFKRVLVRLKDAKFGILFIINVFKIPDFIKDSRVNIISKIKLIFSLVVGILYIISPIDIIPEVITGIFGFADDIYILIWSLGIANEEIEKYKKMIKDSEDSNIIKDVDFYIIKDEKE